MPTSLLSTTDCCEYWEHFPKHKKTKTEFVTTDLIQFASHSTDDGLVSEVEVEPLKVHLPVDPLITVCLI